MPKAQEAKEETQKTELVQLPKSEHEILVRKAALYDLIIMRSMADRKIAQLESELAQLK